MKTNTANQVKDIAALITGSTESEIMSKLYGAGYAPDRVWTPTDMILVYVGGHTVAIVSADRAKPGPDDVIVSLWESGRAHNFVVGVLQR